MGWNLCLATESDRLKAIHLASLGGNAEDEDYEIAEQEMISLSRSFSYALFDTEQLQQWLADEDIELFALDDIDYPNTWQRQEPQRFLPVLNKVREGLMQASAQMPIDHFLFFVDEAGKRWGGSTSITLPFGGIELKVPHEPMMKLDGGHKDLSHRNELRMYNVRIDPELLDKTNHETESWLKKQGLDTQRGSISYGSSARWTNPIMEEPVGWLPVEPVLVVLDCRVEVESVDAQSLFCSDLDAFTRYCEQMIHADSPLYLLRA